MPAGHTKHSPCVASSRTSISIPLVWTPAPTFARRQQMAAVEELAQEARMSATSSSPTAVLCAALEPTLTNVTGEAVMDETAKRILMAVDKKFMSASQHTSSIRNSIVQSCLHMNKTSLSYTHWALDGQNYH